MYDSYDYTTTTNVDPNLLGGFFGALMGIITVISIISLIISVIVIIAMWKMFSKAGKPGWAAIVPIYNIIVMLEVAELPMWYIALFFVPFANIYAMFKIYIEIAHKFGKTTGFGVLTAFFPFICIPILGFGSASYVSGYQMPNQYYNGNYQNQMPNQNYANNYQNQQNQMPNNQFNTNQSQATEFCQNCGTRLNQNIDFCPNCGAKLK